jgi:hypothetical protein
VTALVGERVHRNVVGPILPSRPRQLIWPPCLIQATVNSSQPSRACRASHLYRIDHVDNENSQFVSNYFVRFDIPLDSLVPKAQPHLGGTSRREIGLSHGANGGDSREKAKVAMGLARYEIRQPQKGATAD